MPRSGSPHRAHFTHKWTHAMVLRPEAIWEDINLVGDLCFFLPSFPSCFLPIPFFLTFLLRLPPFSILRLSILACQELTRSCIYPQPICIF